MVHLIGFFQKFGRPFSLMISFLFLVACVSQNEFELDSFFKSLEQESPEGLIAKFKTDAIDSVVLNHKEYSLIYVDAAAKVLEGTSQVNAFEDFITKYDLTMQQHSLVIIAAFHHWLNNRPIDIELLKIEVRDLINRNHENENGN